MLNDNDFEGESGDSKKARLQLSRFENANRILEQFALRYQVDEHTRIPLGKLWTVLWFADREGLFLERELVRWSVLSCLLRLFLVGSVTTIVILAFAALLSLTHTWEERIIQDGHVASVRAIAFSPDGRMLVSAGDDKKVIVWDFEHRYRLATLEDHNDLVTSVAFSSDGSRFATSSYDETVIVWNAKSLTKEAVLRGQAGRMFAAAFTPDEKVLVTTGEDETILWRVGTWEIFARIPLRGNEGASLLFPAGTNDFISNQSRSTWDFTTGRQSGTFNTHIGGSTAALSPDGMMMVSVDSNGEVFFSDFKEQRVLYSSKAHRGLGRAVVFSPDGRFVVTSGDAIILWDVVARAKITTIDSASSAWSAKFSPDGRWLVTGHSDGSIHVWDVLERRGASGFNEHEGVVNAVAWSKDDKRVASGGSDQTVMVWNVDSGKREAAFFGHTAPIIALVFAPDSSSLASMDAVGIVMIWDIAQKRERIRINPPLSRQKVGHGLAISPNGKLIATSHGIYDASTGEPKELLNSQAEFMSSSIDGLDFSPDGLQLAVADNGRPFLLFVENGKRVDSPDLRPRGFSSIRFSSDGKHLATGESTGTIQLWTTEPFNPVAVIGRHDGRVTSLAFSTDGNDIASAGDDKQMALWSVNKRSLIQQIGASTSRTQSLAFSTDGRRLVSGGDDHSVRIFTRHLSLWGSLLN